LDWSAIKNLKSFSVLITSDNPSLSTKTHRISVNRIIGFISVYTLFIVFLVSVIFLFSPLRNSIATKSSALTNEERKLLDDLGRKLINLNNEVDNLRSTNQKLRKAIEQGDPSIISSPEKKSENGKNKIPASGNITFIINKLLAEFGFLGGRETGIFTRPINGFVSRDYDINKGHFGIDYVVKAGTPVYSAGNGYIVFADYTANDGYMMIIAHNNDYVTVYKHCSSLLKKTREIVEQGELIALSGNTGLLTNGPHLHFEVWKNGHAIDPKTVLVN
jgi:murein DD-endopeptidase MepM/ murein hydrolase activator NlpD